MSPINRQMWLPVQDGRVERRVLISYCNSTKITTSCWTTIERKTLEPTRKREPTFKDKEEGAARQKEGHNHDKIKSHTHWVSDPQLENNNTTAVLPLLWRFGTPYQAPQTGDPTKGLGIPRDSDPEGQWDLIIRLPQDWGNRSSSLERHRQNQSTQRLRGKEQWLHRKLNQSYLLVLEGLLWRSGLSGAHQGMG